MKLPQLSLRDLFRLVALVAMACGWWVDHRRSGDLAKREAQRFQELRRISQTWEARADGILRNEHDLDRADKIVWNDRIEGPPYYVVAVDGKESAPQPCPMEKRLFRLIAIMEAKGYRINFQPRQPGDRAGDEEISVERMEPAE